MDKIVQIRNVKKYYGTGKNQVKALNGINLEIEKGKFITIVGTSGSGKSTLLNIIGGIDYPTSGNIIVDGIELTALKEHQLTLFRRYKIGFIYQNYNLLPMLTVKENILFLMGLDNLTPNKEFFDEVVERLHIKQKLHTYPHKLSGGEQQRVAIARALIGKPAIILADEPTGNLDSQTSHDVLGLLKSCTTDYYQTLIMITHNIEISQLSDQTVQIEDGKIQSEL